MPIKFEEPKRLLHRGEYDKTLCGRSIDPDINEGYENDPDWWEKHEEAYNFCFVCFKGTRFEPRKELEIDQTISI